MLLWKLVLKYNVYKYTGTTTNDVSSTICNYIIYVHCTSDRSFTSLKSKLTRIHTFTDWKTLDGLATCSKYLFVKIEFKPIRKTPDLYKK